MPDPTHDLLVDPLIRVRFAGGEEAGLSLPGVLAALATDRIESFRALQLHQEHAWHAFLVQLGAMALHEAASTEPAQDAPTWRTLLLGLTLGDAAAWCLVVPDLARPAFMQPPVPEGRLDGWDSEAFPDGLDVLVTAKNHDIKSNRIAAPQPDHWVFALVSLQTMQGYSGKYNYGIARMNGGFSNRPAVACTPSLDWGPRFRRDVSVLLTRREEFLDRYPAQGGLALLWLTPWDGRSSLSLSACDPYFIEVCRRVRLEAVEGAIQARTTSTRAPRLAAKEAKGNTGDPWTPVDPEEAKALTVGGSGFSYRLMQQILFGAFRPGVAQEVQDRDGPTPLIVAAALARGEGETDGLHTRLLPIPPKVRRFLARPEERARAGQIGAARVQRAADAQRRVLAPALSTLLGSGTDTRVRDDGRSQRWLTRFDAEVDAIFFERLWEDLDRAPDDAARHWAEELRRLARRQLDNAIRSAPLPAARRYKAIAAAERTFGRALSKHFPELANTAAKETPEP